MKSLASGGGEAGLSGYLKRVRIVALPGIPSALDSKLSLRLTPQRKEP